MILGPTHQGGASLNSAVFVGRKRELNLLNNALTGQQMSDEYRVVTVHGVGGQGKSTLIERFRNQIHRMEKPKIPFAIVDLTSLANREVDNGLLRIRNQLHAQGVKFDTFDLAFSRHFKLTRPSRSLKEDYPELFGVHDGIIGEVAELAGTAFTDLPGGKIVFDVLTKLSERYVEWCRRATPIVASLDELSSRELQEQLPVYFGFDLCSYTAKDPPLRPVIFFDTFEALWQRRGGIAGGPGDSAPDAWIRQLVEETPGALFIMSGRRKLQWAEINPQWQTVIVDCAIKDLSDKEQAEFLLKKGVREQEIRRRIIRTSSGHALSLTLQARIYEKLCGKGVSPKAEDFPSTQKEILDRFVDHLEPSLASVLRILAVPSELEEDLWVHLAKTFPAFQFYNYVDIVEDEIFKKTEASRYQMHDVLRSHLIADISIKDRELVKRARLAIFSFHEESLNRILESQKNLGARHISRSEQDRHLLEASTQLLAADPHGYVDWCVSHLLEYQKNGASTARTELLRRLNDQLKLLSSTPLDLVAKLAYLHAAGNPFGSEAREALNALLDGVRHGNVLTDRGLTEIRALVPHLVRSDNHAFLADVSRMLSRYKSAGDDALTCDIVVNNWLGNWNESARALDELLASKHEGISPDWDLFSTACRAPSSLPLRRLLSNVEPNITKPSVLIKLLDTMLLQEEVSKVPIVLDSLFGTTEIAEIVRTIDIDESLDPYLKDYVVEFLAEYLYRSGQAKQASDVLDLRLSVDSLEELSEVTKRRDLLELSRKAAWTSLLQLREKEPTIKRMGFRPVEVIRLRITLSNSMETSDSIQPTLAYLARVADLLSNAEQAVYIDLTSQTLEVPGHPIEGRMDLVVNDRGEGFLFTNDPLFCWRSCDYLALSGPKLFYNDKRIGLGVCEQEISPRLLPYLVAGYRLMVVHVDSRTAKPLLGTYASLYDWQDASIKTTRPISSL